MILAPWKHHLLNLSSILYFFNNIIENKNNRRASYIKKIFKNIINDCFGIDDERKKQILNIFSLKRKPKINLNDDIFFNDIGFTYTFFISNISLFSKKYITCLSSYNDDITEKIIKFEKIGSRDLNNGRFMNEEILQNDLENDFFLNKNKENMGI